jgi:16S rRNA (cytosine1402-N4)-methyltransferase
MIIKHIPVMLKESIDNLNIKDDGIYVDCTFGNGGHSREILNNLGSNGKLISFDYDESVKNWNIENSDKRFSLINDNFSNLSFHLEKMNIKHIDGFLFDLGLSSMQLESNRGFSYREESYLDMRVNSKSELTAEKIINNYSVRELADIFFFFGEERKSYKLANVIHNYSKKNKITTSDQLVRLVVGILGKNKNKQHPAKKVFQALRIAVNNELENLTIALQDSLKKLSENGRVVVISYQSLEDRITKKIFKNHVHENKNFSLLNKKPLIPTKEEIKENNRARSAKMRIICKNSN